MPDWFYRTVAQPVLFRLPDRLARTIALRILGSLSQFRAGGAVIDFLGHMRPDPRLATQIGGVEFSSPIGVGWRADPDRHALRALARFGAGCIEVEVNADRDVVRAPQGHLREIVRPRFRPTKSEPVGLPVLKRVYQGNTEHVLFPSGQALPVFAWDEPLPAANSANLPGVFLQVGSRDSGGNWTVPSTMPDQLPERIRHWRERLGSAATMVISGGVAQPSHAVDLLAAGADLVLVDAGLIYHGPGLVKRCNEALLAQRRVAYPAIGDASAARCAWFWAAVLGAALFLGGAVVLSLAVTRVLLPYDEHYLGLTWDILRRNEPLLFNFMAHDRATLAGTMLGLGWLYVCLALQGIRHAVHGAKTAVVASAVTGFVSFFSFLGFGYFDPLHAFVAAVMFQLLVQVISGREGGARVRGIAIDDEDKSWRTAQWSQFLWVIHSAGLIIAGGVILLIGMTSVFVNEDLEFLCLTADQASALNERLISVVAHDRATLGGMLLASGIAMLLPVVWCFRRGATWLWTAILGLGAPAYAAALGIHFHVGYTDWRHLVPALAGCLLWLAGLLLSSGYLRRTR